MLLLVDLHDPAAAPDGKAYANILKHLGKDKEAKSADKAVVDMEKAVLKDGWDGKWFLRAYDAHGKKVGSHYNDEGQIYIEPQGMCVMAGIGVETGEAP